MEDLLAESKVMHRSKTPGLILRSSLDIHAQDDPPVAHAAFLAGPLVEHHQLKADPAEIASNVLDTLRVGFAIDADEQLRALEVVAARELEESHKSMIQH